MEANPALLLEGAISSPPIREDFITKRGHFSGCEKAPRVSDGGVYMRPQESPTMSHPGIDVASEHAKALAANRWPWLNRLLAALMFA
jgi:hypothetical protein